MAAPQVACRALGDLASLNASSLTVTELADCLRGLEAAEAALTAARASVLWAFRAARGPADDGHGSAKTWVRWQTRVTEGAAGGAVAWARRLHEHPAVAGALASGQLSASWARAVCGWSDLLPGHARSRADQILTDAAVSGAELDDVARLAAEIRRRTAVPDTDRGEPDDGFAGRGLRLGVTFGGAGRLEADLSASCTAALTAILDALGKKAGPEDTRTRPQRRHDALEEACRRLVSARHLPARAGQSTQIQLHLTLDQLRHLPPRTTPPSNGPASNGPASGGLASDSPTPDSPAPGSPTPGPAPGNPAPRSPTPGPAPDSPAFGSSAALGAAGPAGLGRRRWQQAAASPEGSWPPDAASWPAAPPGADCDASIVPVVTGHLDHGLLDDLIRQLQQIPGPGVSCHPPDHPSGSIAPTAHEPESAAGAIRHPPAWSRATSESSGRPDTAGPPAGGPPETESVTAHLPPRRDEALRPDGGLRDLILSRAVELLSGPTGLAAWLRISRLSGVAASASLPLDVGSATETIPAHLRRAVSTRDQHCRFPGCTEPPAACQVHHVIPRHQNGPTCLPNLVLLCSFHHLIVVHRWRWAIRLNADGTTTVTNPTSTKTYHSHRPPPPDG